jgi:DNA/RNA-binding domain of Phe-tRNA-synthetase-like protein
MEGVGVSGKEPIPTPSDGDLPRPGPAGGAGAAGGFEPDLGWCSKEVEEELPQLRLALLRVGLAQSGSVNGWSLSASSPPSVLGRLRDLSNRFRGARAVGVRREPVPAAYRIFYRQIGLDPDLSRTPIEAAVLERMLRGGFLSGGFLEDVLLIALLDTGVPVWALDTGAVDGTLGVRVSREGELLGRSGDAQTLPAGRLVLADGSAALGLLFGELARGARPGARTRELTLFAVQVPGVPMLYVEEALWICHNSLEGAG